jgi:hypothetical protein
MQALKAKSSSDTIIHGDVINKGDAAIGGNAKIVKTQNEKKKSSLSKILLEIVGLVASVITIYLFLKQN